MKNEKEKQKGNKNKKHMFNDFFPVGFAYFCSLSHLSFYQVAHLLEISWSCV
jgi:hypothetical protein